MIKSIFNKKITERGNKAKSADDTLFPVLESEQTANYSSNPYTNARNKYSDIYAKLAANAMTWRITSILLGTMLLFTVFSLCMIARNTKVIPYVIQVDRHGYAIPIQALNANDVDNKVIMSQIGQFIMNSRVRVPDWETQSYFIKQAYRSVSNGSDAYNKLNKYFTKVSQADAKITTEIQVQSIIPISSHTYNAEWTERSSEQNRNFARRYKGIFEVKVSPPTEVTNLIANPLGVYVTNFTIQEMM